MKLLIIILISILIIVGKSSKAFDWECLLYKYPQAINCTQTEGLLHKTYKIDYTSCSNNFTLMSNSPIYLFWKASGNTHKQDLVFCESLKYSGDSDEQKNNCAIYQTDYINLKLEEYNYIYNYDGIRIESYNDQGLIEIGNCWYENMTESQLYLFYCLNGDNGNFNRLVMWNENIGAYNMNKIVWNRNNKKRVVNKVAKYTKLD